MLQKKLKNYELILASKSPRRKQLLSSLGLDFTIQTKEVEEIYPQNLKGEEIPVFLSRLKASAFDRDNLQNKILLTSDTVVWHNNQKLGKPKTKQHALDTLNSLKNTHHEVISGVTLTTSHKQTSFFSKTKVYFDDLTIEEINHYIDKYEPFDKAGSYGIQEWIGMVGIEKIEGDYYNVMGLPLFKLKRELLNFIDA